MPPILLYWSMTSAWVMPHLKPSIIWKSDVVTIGASAGAAEGVGFVPPGFPPAAWLAYGTEPTATTVTASDERRKARERFMTKPLPDTRAESRGGPLRGFVLQIGG